MERLIQFEVKEKMEMMREIGCLTPISLSLSFCPPPRFKKYIGREEKSLEKHYMSPCGRFIVFTGEHGNILVVCGATKQWICTLKMNGTVRSIDFSADGRFMFSIGGKQIERTRGHFFLFLNTIKNNYAPPGDGEVYQWDMDSRTCVHRFHDEGAVRSSVLSCAADGKYMATG